MARYAIVDVEATGPVAARGAVLLEVGAVLVEDGCVRGEFSSLVRGAPAVPPAITALTGIDHAMLASAPTARAVLGALSEFASGALFVAHNAFYDHAHLAKAFRTADLPSPARTRFVCTLQLSRRLYPGAPSHKLYALAALLALPAPSALHRALPDARLTAGLFTALCATLCEHVRARTEVDAFGPALLQRVARSRARRLDACLDEALRSQGPRTENARRT